MPASVGYLVVDAVDPERLARFWCELLDVGVETTIGDGQFVVLSATKAGLTVGFQRVGEGKAGKNRLHLDLMVEDLDQATAEVETLGGRWLEPGSTRELEGFQWRCMADPEGNEFDIDILPTG
jgi:predicted enzyme related to lactoylglutathione lyase